MSQPAPTSQIPPVIPLSTILLNYTKQTHDDLHELIDARLSHSNGVLVDEVQRKKAVAEWCNNKAKQTIRLLSLVRWCQQHGQTLESLQQMYHAIIDMKQFEYSVLTDNMRIVQRNVVDQRLYPVYDIPVAVHTQYHHGQYKLLPSIVTSMIDAAGSALPNKLSDAVIHHTTQRLNQQIHVKLLSTKLPPNIRSITVDDGMCIINVNDELSMRVSLRMEPQAKLNDDGGDVKPLTDEQRIKWRLFDIDIHVQTADKRARSLVNRQHIDVLLQQCNTIMYNNTVTPLVAIYEYIHKFVVTLAIDILYVQCKKVSSTSTKTEYDKHKHLSVQYWTGSQHTAGTLSIDVNESSELHVTHTPLLSHNDVLRIAMNQIDANTLLDAAQQLHSHALLNKITTHFAQLPKNTAVRLSQHTVKVGGVDVCDYLLLHIHQSHVIQIHIDLQTGLYILYCTRQLKPHTPLHKILTHSQLQLNQSIDRLNSNIQQLIIQCALLDLYETLGGSAHYQLYTGITAKYSSGIDRLTDALYVRYHAYPFAYIAVQRDVNDVSKHRYWFVHLTQSASSLIGTVNVLVEITYAFRTDSSTDVATTLTLINHAIPAIMLNAIAAQLRRLLTATKIAHAVALSSTDFTFDNNSLTNQQQVINTSVIDLFGNSQMSDAPVTLQLQVVDKAHRHTNGISNGHSRTSSQINGNSDINVCRTAWSCTVTYGHRSFTKQFDTLHQASSLQLADTVRADVLLNSIADALSQYNAGEAQWYIDSEPTGSYPPPHYFTVQSSDSNRLVLQYSTGNDTVSTIAIAAARHTKSKHSHTIFDSLAQPDTAFALTLSFAPVPYLNCVHLQQLLNIGLIHRPAHTISTMFKYIYLAAPIMPVLHCFCQVVHEVDNQHVIFHPALNINQTNLQYTVLCVAESIDTIRLVYKQLPRCKMDLQLYTYANTRHDYQSDRVKPFRADTVDIPYIPHTNGNILNHVPNNTMCVFLLRWYSHAGQTDLTRRIQKLQCTNSTIQLRNCIVRFNRASISKYSYDSISHQPVYTVDIINYPTGSTNDQSLQPLNYVDIQTMQAMFKTCCFTPPYSTIAFHQLLYICEWRHELLRLCIQLYQLQNDVKEWVHQTASAGLSVQGVSLLHCILHCTVPLNWSYNSDAATQTTTLYVLIALQSAASQYKDMLYLPLAYNVNTHVLSLWYVDGQNNKVNRSCSAISGLIQPPPTIRNAIKQLVRIPFDKLLDAAAADGADISPPTSPNNNVVTNTALAQNNNNVQPKV